MTRFFKVCLVCFLLTMFVSEVYAEDIFTWFSESGIRFRMDSANADPVHGTVYAITDCSVYEAPDFGSAKIGSVFTGDTVYSESMEGDWAKLSSGGYLFAGYLSDVWCGTWPIYTDEMTCKFASRIYKAIAELPESVRSVLWDYTIVLRSDVLTAGRDGVDYSDVLIMGETVFGEDSYGKIRRIDVVADPDDCVSCFYHETGHAVFFQKQLESDASVVSMLLANQAGILSVMDPMTAGGLYAIGSEQSVHELFAESFREYMEDPENLRLSVPDVYGFLADMFREDGIVIY